MGRLRLRWLDDVEGYAKDENKKTEIKGIGNEGMERYHRTVIHGL